MTPYFLLLGYISIFLILSKSVKSDLFFYLSFLTLTLFSGLRFDVGVDFMSYSEMFEDFKNGNALFLVEPANMLIINTINMLNIDNQVVFFIYSVIIMSGVFYFIKKLSPSKELSILVFVTVGIFYFSTFNGIRQWAAVSIMLIGIVKLIESKHTQFFLCIVLASLFHTSAIILFVLVFFKYRFNKLYLILILLSFIFVSELFIYLINNSPYAIYILENGLRYEQKGNPLFLLIYISILIYIPWFLGYFSRKTELNNKEIILLNMNIMSILILILGYQLNIDFLSLMRVNMYFQIQLIVLIPIMMLRIQNYKIKFILMYFIFLFLFFYFFHTLYNNGIIYNLVPYQTIFNK